MGYGSTYTTHCRSQTDKCIETFCTAEDCVEVLVLETRYVLPKRGNQAPRKKFREPSFQRSTESGSWAAQLSEFSEAAL